MIYPSALITTTQDHLHGQVVLLGAGREGWSSYEWLRQTLGPTLPIWVVDEKPSHEWSEAWQAPLTTDSHLRVKSVADISELPPQPLTIFRSPGIPLTHPLFESWQQHDLTITSNTKLAFQLLRALETPPTLLGVTGTKGKSTTTALLHHLLVSAGRRSVVGGNLGRPPLLVVSEALEKTADWVVLELSCHQLADLETSPDMAVIQNITPEHLDIYPDFEIYCAAKSAICKFQNSAQSVIYNLGLAAPVKLATLSQGQHWGFSTAHSDAQVLASTPENKPIVTADNTTIYWDNSPLLTLDELPLVGTHNVENVMPSVVLGHQLQLSATTVREALLSFTPLPHRLEPVGNINGVLYINDSLATTPEAAAAAVKAFPKQRLWLLLGGYDRHLQYQSLAQTILDHQQVAGIWFFPTTGQEIVAEVQKKAAQSSQRVPTFQEITNLPAAVRDIAAVAQPGDVVLLSPASASFTTFTDYQDRGNQFRAAVAELEQ